MVCLEMLQVSLLEAGCLAGNRHSGDGRHTHDSIWKQGEKLGNEQTLSSLLSQAVDITGTNLPEVRISRAEHPSDMTLPNFPVGV